MRTDLLRRGYCEASSTWGDNAHGISLARAVETERRIKVGGNSHHHNFSVLCWQSFRSRHSQDGEGFLVQATLHISFNRYTCTLYCGSSGLCLPPCPDGGHDFPSRRQHKSIVGHSDCCCRCFICNEYCFGTKASNQELLAAMAAYTDVLVVFVGSAIAPSPGKP